MAPTINVSFDGHESVFTFSPVDRAALYGRRRRIALDETGSPCSRASLLGDGSLLLQSGMTAQGYFLPDGVWVPQGELEATQADGSPAERIPSTLGQTQELTEIAPDDLFDLHVHNVYLLEAESITDTLERSLNAGRIFSFPFNFRADYTSETAVLLANDEGIWALIGYPLAPEWQELTTVTSMTEMSEEDPDDDLDFEMF